MKKLSIIFAIIFAAMLSAQTGFGQTTEKEKQETLIKIVRFLEQKPFDENAKKYREWAFLYVVETKEVSVVICGGDLFKPVMDKKNKFGSELLMQYTLSMAAFKLENPDKKNDENAAQLAGIESMLRAYEQMVKENAKAKFAKMDELVAKRDASTLKTSVDAANCGKKDK